MAELDADVIIAGVHFEQYLIRLQRTESLSHPGSEITFTFSEDFPHTTVLPWDTLVVYEQGIKTLTGYIQNIIPQRGPAETTVKGQDTYVRALNWYLPENLFTTGSQNVAYWVDYLCTQAGISYHINDSSGSTIYLNEGIQIGLKLVADDLVTMCGIAQWVMQVDVDGVLQFTHIGQPYTPEFVLNQVESYEFERNDLDTRNRVVVWGWQETTGSGGSIRYSASRIVTGVPDVRNMVFAEPNIVTNTQASQLGEAALDQWAKLESVIAIETVGNASIRAGDAMSVYSGQFTSGSYLDTVTDMESILDVKGYNQNITAGRRAYRYPYWPVGGVVETGNPTIDWGYESVPGEAFNLWLLPGRNLFFVGGYTYRNYSSGSDHVWRLECRNLSTGSLVWGQDMTDTGTLPGFIVGSQINGVFADSTGVYVIGWDQAVPRTRVEKYQLTGGSQVWRYIGGAYGSDIVGDGTHLYYSTRDVLVPPPTPGQSTMNKLDYSGSLVTSVNLTRNSTPPFNFDLKVYTINHLYMRGDGLYLGGSWNVTIPSLYTPQIYLARYDFGLNKIWEQFVYDGATSAPGNGEAIGMAVVTDKSYVYASTLYYRVAPDLGSLWRLNLSGSTVDRDDTMGGINMADGYSWLFTINQTKAKLKGYRKDTASVTWTTTPGGTYNGIRYLNYAGKLYVCGVKNGNFYVARYGV